MSTTLIAPEAQTPDSEMPALTPTMPPEHDTGERRHRWTRDEYHRMAEAGLFNDKRVELLDGEIWTLPPQMTPHAVSVGNTRRVLEAAFGAGYFARDQAPVVLNDGSEPEPAVVIVPGVPNDYFPDHPHPTQVAVLVEISDSTLRDDRRKKARAYARAGIADYWIVNLVDRQLEVHRDPSPEGIYQDIQILGAAKFAAPLSAPDAKLRVADLLPPAPE